MKIQNFFLFLIIFLTFQSTANAQEFGQHPTDIDWKVMNSKSAKIIFPEGMDAQAQRISDIINHMDENNQRSVGKKTRRLEMVLQNRTTIPNGYVGLAPFMSEFFATPPQSSALLGSMEWLETLAIHEYRHAQQFSNSRHGLTNFLYYFQGQSGWQLGQLFSVPNFYSEGDAVVMETALSEAGRGRTPDFTKEQRALAFANQQPSYMQMRGGSFKKLIPDHYRWGYMMNQYVRNEFGNDVPGRILKTASSYRPILFPYSGANKRHTGMRTGKIYNASWQRMKKKWEDQLASTELMPTEKVIKEKRTVTNYLHPRFMEDGSILAMKNSFKKTDRLVQIKDGKEKTLTTIGINVFSGLTYNNGVAAWTELGTHVRWGNETFSDIVVYNLKTDSKKKITKKARLFSPAVSPDASKIAAVHVSPNQEFQIWILDANSGNVLQKIDNPGNAYLARLAWSNDGNSIVSVFKKNNKMSLAKFDLAEGTITQLTEPTSHILDDPFVKNGRVYFGSSYTGIDNIFSTDLGGSKEIRQETSVKIAATKPAVSDDGKTLVFADFTGKGNMLSTVDLTENKDKKIEVVEPKDMALWDNVANVEEGGNILGKFATTETKVKNYSGFLKGMKLHSWNFSPSIAEPSLDLRMRNLRNDVSATLGAGYNRNENQTFYRAGTEIGRTFVTFGVNGTYGGRSVELDTARTETFKEASVGGTVGLPLRWIRGNYSTNLNLSAGAFARNLSDRKIGETILDNTNLTTLETALNFSNLRRTALQNVGPRSGQKFSVSYKSAIQDQSNERLSAEAAIYLPGLSANHALRIRGSHLNELTSNTYQFQDEFEYSRGYNAPIVDNFTKVSVDYALPLFYPEFSIWRLAYFNRVRAQLFYDYGVGQVNNSSENIDLSSAGAEVLFDAKFLNILPMSIGFRYSRLLNDDPMDGKKAGRFEVALGTDF